MEYVGSEAVFSMSCSPAFAERAPSSEAFVTGPASLPGEFIHLGEEPPGHLGGQEILAILGEDALVEAALAEPAV